MVSKNELDWNGIQAGINKQVRGLDWPVKVRAAIPGASAKQVQFSSTSKGNIGFTSQVSDNEVVYCIVEFDKQ